MNHLIGNFPNLIGSKHCDNKYEVTYISLIVCVIYWYLITHLYCMTHLRFDQLMNLNMLTQLMALSPLTKVFASCSLMVRESFLDSRELLAVVQQFACIWSNILQMQKSLVILDRLLPISLQLHWRSATWWKLLACPHQQLLHKLSFDS